MNLQSNSVLAFIVGFVIGGMLVYIIFLSHELKNTSTLNNTDSSQVSENDLLHSKDTVNPYRDADLTIIIINGEEGTWGYDVLLYGSILVHQPHIPCLPGNNGFKTKEDAEKVASLVIEKIRRNEMPPVIGVDDLKALQIIK